MPSCSLSPWERARVRGVCQCLEDSHPLNILSRNRCKVCAVNGSPLKTICFTCLRPCLRRYSVTFIQRIIPSAVRMPVRSMALVLDSKDFCTVTLTGREIRIARLELQVEALAAEFAIIAFKLDFAVNAPVGVRSRAENLSCL